MMIVPPIALLLILPTWLIVISLDFILFVILKIYSFKNKTIKNS